MELLHILPALGPGGPARSLVALVTSSRTGHPHIRHSVLSLQPGEYMPLTFELRRQGAEVLRGCGIEAAAARIGRADIVMLHLWNTPRIWRLLASDLPAARYMVWVNGARIASAAASQCPSAGGRRKLVFTAPPPPAHALQFGGTPVIPGLIDRPGIASLSAEPHDGFNVDYIGTTNRGKMHPRFIGMMARLDIPDLRVRICGGALDPAMAAELAELPGAGRFECRGFVEDIAPILATSDVFAYPLAERTYATSDKTLQEAMLAGVPPVNLCPMAGRAASSRTVRMASSPPTRTSSSPPSSISIGIRKSGGRSASRRAARPWRCSRPTDMPPI